MINWLVVYLPLWKIWKSVGMIIPNIWKVIKFHGSSHHQAVKWTSTYFYLPTVHLIRDLNSLISVCMVRISWAITFICEVEDQAKYYVFFTELGKLSNRSPEKPPKQGLRSQLAGFLSSLFHPRSEKAGLCGIIPMRTKTKKSVHQRWT